MITSHLICHPTTRSNNPYTLTVIAECKANGNIHLEYQLLGDIESLIIPPIATPVATDNLWQHTCFEAFIAVADAPYYHELNFSPSSQWAAYAFSQTRIRYPWVTAKTPLIECTHTHERLNLSVIIKPCHLPPNDSTKPLVLGLSAVLESQTRACSYWALNHPAPMPDFHDREGFILPLKTL